MNPYITNKGRFTPFTVGGVKYDYRRRFVNDVDGGNIVDVRYNKKQVGATSVDDDDEVPLDQARSLVQRMARCFCKECEARRRSGKKP